MSAGICTCGFELAKLPAKHKVKTEDGADLDLSCPMCAAQLQMPLENLEILVRGKAQQTEYARWKLTSSHPAGSQVNHGAFQIRFETLKTIEPREVCYAKIPVFINEAGETTVPDLPVRESFLDCIDQDRLARMRAAGQRAELVGGDYQVELPLKGLQKLVSLRLPVLLHKSPAGKEERAFRDINLRIWPNVAIADWGYYLVGISATGERADALLSPSGARVRLRARSATDKVWRAPLSSTQRGGHLICGVLDQRPRWISLEVFDQKVPADPSIEAASGGLFFVPPVEPRTRGELRMGLDFGTSNTCVAFTSDVVPDAPRDTPQLLPQINDTRWNQYLIRGGKDPVSHAAPDLWPSPVGFGLHADLFASELLFSRTKVDQMAALDAIAHWKLGVDFGIPSGGIQPQFAEADHVLGDFKWREMLSSAAPPYGPHIEHLQAHYIAAVLLTSYLRVAAGKDVAPDTIVVLCSFPMSFDNHDLSTLTAALDRARQILEKQTGLSWSVDMGADESTAASANAGDPGAEIHAYLDMGGGSTDVAINFERKGKRETVYLGSVRYAGMALLNAFEGEGRTSSCLAGKTTVDVLRRRVREARTVKELLGDPGLFNKHQEAVLKNRILHFYGYIVEYAARMVAAGFLDQRFTVQGENGDRSFPPQLRIAVFFLGNGWRFQGAMAEEFEASLSNDIFRRALQLLKEEQSPYALELMKLLKGVKVSQKPHKLSNVPHEKAAVALGLLKTAARIDRKNRPKPASILGWTTKVDGKLEIPWFAMYTREKPEPPALPGSHTGGEAVGEVVIGQDEPSGSRNELDAVWYDNPLPKNATFDWRDTNPKVPSILESPFELDEDLNFTRVALKQQCHTTGADWFIKGPYEVMLEELFRKKLRIIGA